MKIGSKKKTVYLADYKPSPYLVEDISLVIDLHETQTQVTATLKVRRQHDVADAAVPLVLNGRALTLKSVTLDGKVLTADDYQLAEESLTIPNVPEAFTLHTVVDINPKENTSLQGIYLSNGIFCSHCEPEDFQRITYYIDRPDNLARFTTNIIADKAKYPVLLCNGNVIEKGELEEGRHFVVWEDPFKKPSYLFAVIAGQLVSVDDTYTTGSGRAIGLHIFVEPQNRDRCDYAMLSLKNAMRWDEETFGLEYDLEHYYIVAVDDFNMGAMENKGLNVFNTKYILADPQTATDIDYQNIEAVVGHEYFHNWTGNRVTCRDWFQLSLKEGLTVFREQLFSGDMGLRSVKRIQDVRLICEKQFLEDAGPLAHPVLPKSYIEMNNFYTLTVYHKGAEVIAMLYTMLGKAGFRAGMNTYFERFDGFAVTIDDFVGAMEAANNIDLTQFKRWYDQAGTPVVKVMRRYNEAENTYRLTFKQYCPPTPGQSEKAPFVIPIKMGLLDSQSGAALPIHTTDSDVPAGETECVLRLNKPEQTFHFAQIPNKPTPSLLRHFSAPVRLQIYYTSSELQFLLQHDTDPVVRWQAAQELALRALNALIDEYQQNKPLTLDPHLVDAFEGLLADKDREPALLAEILQLPSANYIAAQMEVVDVEAICAAHQFLIDALAKALMPLLQQAYQTHHTTAAYALTEAAIGARRLKNSCLFYLARIDETQVKFCQQAFRQADNMTDQMGALSALSHSDSLIRQDSLQAFYEQAQDKPLLVNKWLTLHATSPIPSVFDEVKDLLGHTAFRLTNPNNVYALLGAFAQQNFAGFHLAAEESYSFLGDQILALDAMNPGVAAHLVSSFSRWRHFDSKRQTIMKTQLERILAKTKLSNSVYEVVSKCLGS